MQTNYRAKCGAAAGREDHIFENCGNCHYGSEQFIPNVIPIQRVVLMTVASGGLYFFFWFYLTWKQYGDHTREQVYPFWHVVTQSVPIYGLFRVHAHMRTYAGLMSSHDVRSTINPLLAVAIIFIVNVLSPAAWLITLQDHLSQGQAVAALALAVMQTAITAWLVIRVQRNLNRYWNSASTNVGHARVGAGEVVLAVLGCISWGLMLGAVASESFRAL